eukprot:gb/GEZJ01006813.1/.p1 GENE.gb/GEZJ01006813.1/~~gb/GEZJ01006813.1/.p1  ORF type:complete len:100 (+),score=2.25 gb/GEZJ01006813.1/:244-543(+)
MQLSAHCQRSPRMAGDCISNNAFRIIHETTMTTKQCALYIFLIDTTEHNLHFLPLFDTFYTKTQLPVRSLSILKVHLWSIAVDHCLVNFASCSSLAFER